MKHNVVLALILSLFAAGLVPGQMTRKPSPTREPEGVMDKKPDSDKRHLPAIGSRQEFDLMARVYHPKTPYALPHAMFVIDRRENNRIYYVNSQKYRFHKDFLIANYLVLKGQNLFEDIYIKENRRFIVGTIAWQKTVDKFTFEFWEGDLIPADQIRTTYDVINRTFYEKVHFKPNSIRHEELTAGMDIGRVTSDEISRNQEYLALNTARSVGRVHIIDKLDDTVEIGYNEIIVLNEVPLSLPPVRGIIVTRPSTPLSHINLLAKGWGIPNAYIKDADKLLREHDTWWVEFETTLTDYKIKRVTKDTKMPPIPQFEAPPSNLEVKKLATLKEMRARDSVVYGAKAANLGEVASAGIPNIVVPEGFGVPLHYYEKFMKENGFDDRIFELQQDLDFVHNPRYRRQKLEELRAEIRAAPFDAALRAEILGKWRTVTGGKGVFVRSSSNAEDMPNFSGAGLYTTVKNVKDPDKIIEAVKTVWASLWNFEAYEARERNFIRHDATYMGVLVQVGVDMDNGGVMITRDPFDRENRDAFYISAVWGHNLIVVGDEEFGRKETIPEQILYSRKSNAVQVLTRSNQETIVRFDEGGGLKETEIPTERRVLTDKMARDLVAAAAKIKRVFGDKTEQDIEWGYKDGRIVILQARPFIDN